MIPRAAAVSFEKIDGSGNRAAGSGIRAPSRISGMGMQGLAKSSANKNWQMKATYVEVRAHPHTPSEMLLTAQDLQRATPRSPPPRVDPPTGATSRRHPRGHQGPHPAHWADPSHNQFHRRPAKRPQFRFGDPADRCNGRQRKVFALPRRLQLEFGAEKELHRPAHDPRKAHVSPNRSHVRRQRELGHRRQQAPFRRLGR